MDIAQRLLELFGGNEYYAVAKTSEGGGYWYDTIYEPPTIDIIQKHLEGSMAVGLYPVQKVSLSVTWLGWDVDCTGDMEAARKFTKQILGVIGHLPHAIEFSGSKGYHIYLFLDEPMPASKAKDISEWVRDSLEIPKAGTNHVECYPKQATLDPSNPKNIGNLMKLPLGVHPTSHNRSMFVNSDNGWENGGEVSPKTAMSETVSVDEVMALKSLQQDTMDLLATTLSVEWNEGKRHELAIYLAGYLVQIGWVKEQVDNLIRRIVEIRTDDREELFNRLEAVERTFKEAARGKAIAGFSRLTELLTGEAMRILTHKAPELANLPMARQVDQVRFDKGAAWLKERKISNLCWAWLTDMEEGGRILRVDPSGVPNGNIRTFWYSKESKIVVDMETSAFSDVLFQKFGLNPSERLVGNVMSLLKHMARDKGRKVNIHRISYYDEEINTLYVNFGGAQIFVCDGNGETYIIENGDNGIFFEASNLLAPNPDFSNPLDVWDTLINPINFSKSDDAPIEREAQAEMLKAWILAFYFRDIMPTRPILTLIGAPGSGKTTAMRQVLRLVEGMDSDVSNIAEEKPDSWRAMLERYNMIVLDNLEGSNARWLPKELDLVATGSSITVRKLYTTNETYQIVANSFVAITAVNIPFNKATVFERMLTLNMDKLEQFKPAHLIQRELADNYPRLLADLLLKLNEVVKTLGEVKTVRIAQQVRMADFAMFAAKLKFCEPVIDGDQLLNGIRSLGTAQQAALAQSETSAFPIIQDWLESGPEEIDKNLTTTEFFNIVKSHAKNSKNFYWNSAKGFTTHLRAIESILREQLGVELFKATDPSRPSRERTFVRFLIKFGEEEPKKKNGHRTVEWLPDREGIVLRLGEAHD